MPPDVSNKPAPNVIIRSSADDIMYQQQWHEVPESVLAFSLSLSHSATGNVSRSLQLYASCGSMDLNIFIFPPQPFFVLYGQAQFALSHSNFVSHFSFVSFPLDSWFHSVALSSFGSSQFLMPSSCRIGSIYVSVMNTTTITADFECFKVLLDLFITCFDVTDIIQTD